MKINEFKYEKFKLAFKSPFSFANEKLTEREGLIIRIKDELGKLNYGEISPLPNINSEKFDDIIISLDRIKTKIKNSEITTGTELADFISTCNSPSISFGIEQALQNFHELQYINFSNRQIKSIKVNAVLGITNLDDLFKRTNSLIDAGFSTIKFKIAKNNIDLLISLFTEMRKSYGDKIIIRLDANGMWDVDYAVEVIPRIKQFNIEYIEQPVKEKQDLLAMAEKSEINIAPDELINSFKSAQDFLTNKYINYIVLKPMNIGYSESIKIIELANQLNKKVIISSTFESVVGRSALVLLASLVMPDTWHGLDTARFFASDLDTDKYNISNGIINFDPGSYPPSFNLNHLFDE